MTQLFSSALRCPEGRQEVARSVRAGICGLCDAPRSEGPTLTRAATWPKSRFAPPLRQAFRAWSAVAIALVIAFTTTHTPCQENNTSPLTAGAAEPTKGRSLSASLLLIKADWSQSPAAKEIEGELRQALAGSEIPEKLLGKLPNSAAQTLFPPRVAGLYSNKDYNELVTWMRVKGVFNDLIPFRPEEGTISLGDGRGINNRRSTYLAMLETPYSLLSLPALSEANNQPFVTREQMFRWYLRPQLSDQGKVLTAGIERRLVVVERARGQEPQEARTLDACDFLVEDLQDDSVWITNAFPTETQFQQGARRNGFEVLIVVGRNRVELAEAAPPKLHLPLKVQTFEPNHRIGYTFAHDSMNELIQAKSKSNLSQSDSKPSLSSSPEDKTQATVNITAKTPATPLDPKQVKKPGQPGNVAEVARSEEYKTPAFTASLIRIKTHWSTSPAAKEIEADLRNALRGEKNADKLLQELPATGAGIIFSPSAAVIYTKEHYAQLLAWLKARNLMLEQEPFEPAKPAAEGAGGNVAVLMKNADFVQLESRKATSELFFANSSRFTWTIHTLAKGNEWSVERDFRRYEQARGQEQPKPANTGDHCYYQIAPLADGQVLIASAFPAGKDDSEYQMVEMSNGFLTLIVIQQGSVRTELAAEARLLLPEKVERINAKLIRGVMGRVGLATAAAAAPSVEKAQFVITDNLMINWSQGLDTAWGFSKSLGKWAKQEVKPPAKDDQHLVADNKIAVWRVESAYYGYSSETGTWDVLRLESGHAPPQELYGDVARVHDGDDVYAFASATGRWSSPKGEEVAIGDKPKEVVVKVFALRNAKATDAERLITQLFARKIQSAAADERTNSLIVSGQSDDLNIIYHILTRLDEPLEADRKPPATASREKTEAVTNDTVEKLKLLYDSHDRQATTIAREIRELKSDKSADQGQIDKLSVTLRQAVTRALATRQQLHKAEASQLQQRLASIEKNLQMRERLSEAIVDHRVQELLNPDVQWPVPATAPSNATSVATPQPQPEAKPSIDLHGLQPPPRHSVMGSPPAIITAVLGVEVEQVRFNEAGFGTGFVINKISPGREPSNSGLRVGDIIVGVNQWQTYSEAMLAWTLLQPADKRLLRPNAKERATRETVPIHLLRDHEFTTINVELQPWSPQKRLSREESANALKERGELFSRLRDDPKWIENAKDDYKRATTDEERRSAREVELSWQRDIVKALQRLRQLGEQVDTELAAAEAEVQQAETSLPNFTTIDLRLLESLGLKVRPLTKEEASEPKYLRCLKIIESAADGPARELKVGDILVALQVTGTSVPNTRLVQMDVLRGRERLSVSMHIQGKQSGQEDVLVTPDN